MLVSLPQINSGTLLYIYYRILFLMPLNLLCLGSAYCPVRNQHQFWPWIVSLKEAYLSLKNRGWMQTGSQISWSSLELFNNLAYTRSTSLAVRNQLIAAQLMNDIECISSYFLHKNKGLTLLKSWFLHRKLTWCQILMGWLENICQMYLFSKIFLTSTLFFVSGIVKLLWRKLSGELDSAEW